MPDASSAVSPSGIRRLEGQAPGQLEAADTQLAMAGYTNPTAQDAHPSAQRLAAPAWKGKTSTLNHAQAAEDRADIWVTVPVDKVETKGGSSTVSPVYASPTGYQARPGESAGSIPPTIPAGRPY